MLRENASATATPCLENHLAKLLPEQNLLEEMMHTSPFMSSEPVLLEVTKSSKECNSGDTLHFCEDKRSSSSSIKFKPPSFGPEYVVLDHDRDTTKKHIHRFLKLSMVLKLKCLLQLNETWS